MPLSFRRATNTDRPAIHRLVDEVLRSYGLNLLLETSDVDLADVEASYDARGGTLELIEDAGGTLLGIVGWRPGEGDVWELKKLYLSSSARGRGIGRLALDRAIAAARAGGASAMVLETSESLVEANRLYTKAGFVPVTGEAAGSFATLSEECDVAYRLELGEPDSEG